MSDFTPEDNPEASLRARLWRALDLGIEIESQIRKGNALDALMCALREDADLAMAEFATANCGDTNLIMALQSRVFRFRYAFETFDAIISRGKAAEATLRAEDRIERERVD